MPLTLSIELTRDGQGWDPRALPEAAQRYLLRRGEGGPKATAPFPWDGAQQRTLQALARLGPEARARLGEQLAQCLAPAGWAELGQDILAALDRGEAVLLALRLRAAELFLLPWELLRLPDGAPLGEVPGLLLQLEWPDAPARARRADAEGRLDAALAESGVLLAHAGAVPAEAHRAALVESCRAGFRALRELPDATLAGLEQALAQEPPVGALHLLVHGHSDGLELAEGRVDPMRLAARLRPYADRVRLVVLCACESAKAQGPGSALGSVAEALHRAGFEAVIAARDPLSKLGSIRLAEALYPRLVVQLESLESALLAAREALPEADRRALQLWLRAENQGATRPLTLRPYRGLEPFDPAHARFFFGREAETQEVLDDLRGLQASGQPRMLFVLGASGSGKSSLVRAAVRPKIEANYAQTVVLRPTDALSALPPERPLLALMDQAEEAFTALSDSQRSRWIQDLFKLARDEAGSAVIFTMRVDFLGRCAELVLPDGRNLDQLAYDEAHRVFIPSMGRAQLREVILGPARLAGLPVQEGLAEQLIDEVVGEPGALPLLEYALDLAWRERAPGEGLTLAGYRALGGAVGALLERQADALLDAMGEAEQAAARHLLVQLVSTGEGERPDTRRVRRREALGDVEGIEAALTRLTEARLVVTGGRDGEGVEIAHEELIRRWGRLRRWVDADRQKWIEVERVRGWTHLLRGGQLDRAREARARWGSVLGAATLAHIEASEAALAAEEALEAQRQAEVQTARDSAVAEAARAKGRTRLALGFGALALGVAALAVSFFTQAREGEAAALLETQRSKNVLAFSAATRVAGRDPALARAFLRDINVEVLDHIPGLEALIRDVHRSDLGHPSVLIAQRARVNAAALAPPGDRLLIALEYGQTALYDAQGFMIGEPLPHELPVLAVAWTADGARALTAPQSEHLYAWTRDGDAVGSPVQLSMPADKLLPAKEGPIILAWSKAGHAQRINAMKGEATGPALEVGAMYNAAALSADGAIVALGGTNGHAYLWREGSAPALDFDHGSMIMALALSPDGGTLAVASMSTVQLWDTQRGEPLGDAIQAGDTVRQVWFAPDGQRVLINTFDGTLALRAARPAVTPPGEASPEPAQVLELDAFGVIEQLAFSPDGDALVYALDGGAAHVARFPSLKPTGTVLEHGEPLLTLAWSSDGATIVTAASELGVRLWPTTHDLPPAPLQAPAGLRVVTLEGDVVRAAANDGLTYSWSLSSGALLGAEAGAELASPARPWLDEEAFVGASLARTVRGQLVLIDGRDRRLLDPETGAPLERQDQAYVDISDAIRAPSGWVATRNAWGAVQVWASANAPMTEPFSPGGKLTALGASADGGTLLLGGADGGVRLLRLVQDASKGDAPGAWEPRSLMDPILARYVHASNPACLPAIYRVEYLGEAEPEAQAQETRCRAERAAQAQSGGSVTP